MNRGYRRGLAFSLLLVLVLGASASARPASAYPRWTGARVYAPAGKSYARLTRHIESIEASRQSRYTVAIVQSSGAGEWATRNYLDALHAVWLRGGDAAQRLRGTRHILIVLALKNRQLAVRASTELQSRYGLRGQAIDRTYVRPNFIRYAKSGRYEDGLIKLIDAFEAAIQKVDRRLKATAAEAVRRDKSLRQAAADMLEALPVALAEVRKNLATAAQGGLATTALEGRLKAAEAVAKSAESQLATSAASASELAARARREVGKVQMLLASMRAASAVLGREIAGLAARLTAIEGSLEQLSTRGMSTGELRLELDRLEGELGGGPAAEPARPVEALRAVRGLGESAGRIEALVRAVPARHAEWQAAVASTTEDLQAVAHAIDAAREEGVDVGAAAKTLSAARAGIGAERPDSYRDAITSLGSLRSELRAQRDALGTAQARRRFWTHSLPRYIGLGLAGLAFLFMLVRLLIRASRKRRATRVLNSYLQARERTEEHLETLRQTHRQLTLSDPDFTASLRGETRRVYDHIGAAFDDFRRRFRGLGDTWDEAAELIEREGLFTWKKLNEAYAQLLEAAPPKFADQIKQRCELPLARLDRAHEVARAAQQVLTDDIEAITAAVDEVRLAGLGTQAYAPTRRALERQLTDGGKELRHDPLGVAESFAAAHADAAVLVVTTQSVLTQLRRSRALEEREQALHAEATELRADGFRFVEHGADPDPILSLSERERQRAIAALDSGDPQSGQRALDQATQYAEDAAEAMRHQVEGRVLCREGIPHTRSESERLRVLLDATRPHLTVLEADFDSRSWAEVEEIAALSEEALTTGKRKLAEAESESTDDVQRYAHAGALVREVQAAFGIMEVGLVRTAALRQELETQRTACKEQVAVLKEEGDRVRTWFERDDRDRAPANQRLGRALENLRGAVDRAGRGRPHWPELAAALTAVATGIARAEELAAADLRLAAAAAAEIDEARRRIEDADGFYGHGVAADLDHAEAVLDQAESALRRQEYEEAIIHANDAEQAAEEADAEAREEVRAKRRAERAAERRRSSRDTGLGIMGSGFGSSSSSSSSFSSWSGGSSSGSSFGGGSSGTSQSSW